MAEHYSQDSYLYFIRSIGQYNNRGHSISKWLLLISTLFYKMQTAQYLIFVLLCLYSKHAQRTSDIRWRNTIHRTLIFILSDPLANRGHSISKWLLLNSCCFLKDANSTEFRFFCFAVPFFKTRTAHN